MTDKPTVPGTVNGFRVLAAIEVTPAWDTVPEWIVLCDKGEHLARDRYVTWRVASDIDAYSGHYHTSYRNAVNDFAQRAGILAEVNQHVKTLEDMVRARDELIDDMEDRPDRALGRPVWTD